MVWKKRANITSTAFYVLFSLAIAAFFIIAVFAKIKAADKNSLFHKKFYARDLALLVDALHASNGEFVMGYDFNPPEGMELDIRLSNDKVIVTDRSGRPVEQRAQATFLFGTSKQVIITQKDINRSLIDFNVVNYGRSITFRFPDEDIKLKENPKTEEKAAETGMVK